MYSLEFAKGIVEFFLKRNPQNEKNIDYRIETVCGIPEALESTG